MGWWGPRGKLVCILFISVTIMVPRGKKMLSDYLLNERNYWMKGFSESSFYCHCRSPMLIKLIYFWPLISLFLAKKPPKNIRIHSESWATLWKFLPPFPRRVPVFFKTWQNPFFLAVRISLIHLLKCLLKKTNQTKNPTAKLTVTMHTNLAVTNKTCSVIFLQFLFNQMLWIQINFTLPPVSVIVLPVCRLQPQALW